MSKAINKNTVEPVTDSEESKIREEIDHWIISQGRASSNGKLHLPHDIESDEPLCKHEVSDLNVGSSLVIGDRCPEWNEKDVAVFPPGYIDICQVCGAVWRGDFGDSDTI